MDLLRKLAAELRAGDVGEPSRAEAVAQAFYRDLREHIDFEDDLLAPVLRELDAWGGVRADQLTQHHREQRQQLRILAERSPSEPPQGLANLLEVLIDDLRTDMAYEEREVLSADLLHDDLVTDCEDG
jgi:iron-sulfur cluster repair protein YtfE (RIC family)